MLHEFHEFCVLYLFLVWVASIALRKYFYAFMGQKWGPLSFLWWSGGHPLTSFKQWTLSLLNPLPSCAYSALTKHIVPHLRPNSSTTVFVSQLHFTFIELTFERSSYIHLWRLGCILKFIAVHAKLSLKVKWAKTMRRVWKGTLSLCLSSHSGPNQPTLSNNAHCQGH